MATAERIEKWLTVVPAYGRDYQTAEDVLAHWIEGKDFLIRDVSCRWNGSYMSSRDSEAADVFKVRYGKLANYVLIRRREVMDEIYNVPKWEWYISGKSDGTECEEEIEG